MSRCIQQRGISLVEVMVSVALGLFILAGVVQLYATSTQNAMTVNGASQIQENARYVFSKLEADIAQSGFAGCFSMANASDRVTNLLTSNAAAGDFYDFSEFMHGKNDEAVGDLNFDQFTLRYFSAVSRQPLVAVATGGFQVADSSQFVKGQIAMVGDCSRAAIFMVTNDADSNTSNVVSFTPETGEGESGEEGADEATIDHQLGELVTTTNVATKGAGVAVHNLYGGKSGAFFYHVAKSAAAPSDGSCSAATAQFCALYRASKPGEVGDELVEGVEAFEVEYGWQDHENGTLYFGDASKVGTNWSLIDRVRVSITLNSVARSPTVDGSERLARSYTRTIMVHNQFPRDNQVYTAVN